MERVIISAIEIQDLSKNYGSIRALDSIQINVTTGSIYGYLGPNGAGKTTTMKILVGLLHYQSGSVKIFGQEVKKAPNEIRNYVGFLPDAELPQNSSIERFLTLTAKMNNLTGRKNCISEVLNKLGLSKLRNRKISNLSRGQKQRVGLANALLTDPPLLILDEPNRGLDPIARMKVLALLKNLAKEGITIFLSSHIIGEIEKIATDIAIIHQGKIIEQGKRSELQGQILEHKRYLITGELDIKKVANFNYISSCKIDCLGRYNIVASGNVTEEQLLLDLIQEANSRIKSFSSAETSLEDLFLGSINEKIKEGVVI
ncbi:MAG: ABC transporter ATP-binding protein [Candidatus Heimdallarchaeota archaeon]|nr:MAG: ABC transporter ATP-binding protein [Candidatus Heimdallarchaeota archaeon]